MADQNDYGSNGNNGVALVPGSLTCYRHFAMTVTDLRRALAPMSDPYLRTYSTDDRVFTAGCNRKARYAPTVAEKILQAMTAAGGCNCSTCSPNKDEYAEARLMFFDEDNRDIHTPPVLGCSCGFYAHYDPQTDFYQNRTWGPAEGRNSLTFFPSGMAIVRAVVEMTGTTVMGRRGVRAQTMSIKALSIDWAKYCEAPGGSFWATGTQEPSPNDSYRLLVEDAGRQTALKYNARYFADFAEMYAAFPKADISALGIEEALPEPPVPDERGFDWKTAQLRYQQAPYYYSQQQVQSYTSVTKTNAPGGFTATISMADADWDRLKADIKDSQLTPMQRAILAKRNRPAPPGTGINYRDRKSR